LEVTQSLAGQRLMRLEGDLATAEELLMSQAWKFEADMQAALEELEKKHAFERG
jgi:hypothetical protein